MHKDKFEIYIEGEMEPFEVWANHMNEAVLTFLAKYYNTYKKIPTITKVVITDSQGASVIYKDFKIKIDYSGPFFDWKKREEDLQKYNEMAKEFCEYNEYCKYIDLTDKKGE